MNNSLYLLRIALRFSIWNKMPYYAVAKGRKPGIFLTWPECSAQVSKFNNAVFRKFKTKREAEDFIALHSNVTQKKRCLDENTSPTKDKGEDFWPEDISDDGDDLLIAAAESIDELRATPMTKKRKLDFKKLGYDSIVWEPVGLKKFGKFEFPIDSEGYVIVYTDGSCEDNGQDTAVAGFGVYFSENHPLNTAKPVSGRATNNCGEIQAATYAIQIAKEVGISKLRISTDSQFLIKSITLWIPSWRRKGWLTKFGKEVKNIIDFKELDSVLHNGNIKVKWNYVRGHNGIVGNEKADRLARQGAAMYRKQKNM